MMVKVLFTGGGSFIARSVVPILRASQEVYAPLHQELDLTDVNSLKETLSSVQPDLVVHCAVRGGRRTDLGDDGDALRYNLCMIENLEQAVKATDIKVITFGSGAEYSRFSTRGFSEHDFKLSNYPASEPLDVYGQFKRAQAKICRNNDRFFNFRLFGCFGPLEAPDRFFSSVVRAAQTNEPITVFKNARMSFLFVEDVCAVINETIRRNFDIPSEINLVYGGSDNSCDLLSAARLVRDAIGSTSKIVVLNPPHEYDSYYGQSLYFDRLFGSCVVGLQQGIATMMGKNDTNI